MVTLAIIAKLEIIATLETIQTLSIFHTLAIFPTLAIFQMLAIIATICNDLHKLYVFSLPKPFNSTTVVQYEGAIMFFNAKQFLNWSRKRVSMLRPGNTAI